MSAMRRGREGGESGGSGGLGEFVAGEGMVVFVAEAAVVEGVGVVGAGALGVGGVVVGRVVVGEIVVDVGAGKGVLNVVAVTAESGSAGCGEGFETFFHAFLFYSLPLFAHSISENLPHLLAQIIVSFGKSFHLDTFPGFGVVTLLHKTFVPFTAGIGRFIWEVLGGNRLPIHALLTSSHEQVVIARRP